MQTNKEDGQISLFAQDTEFGKMFPALSPVRKEKTSKSSSNRSSKLKNHTFMLLDLRPGAGNILGPCWDYDPVWLGSLGTWVTWDAQYLGVPQRRRRIFLIADFAGYSPVQILFIPDSLPGNSAQGGRTGEGFAAAAGNSPETPVWDHECESK